MREIAINITTKLFQFFLQNQFYLLFFYESMFILCLSALLSFDIVKHRRDTAQKHSYNNNETSEARIGSASRTCPCTHGLDYQDIRSWLAIRKITNPYQLRSEYSTLHCIHSYKLFPIHHSKSRRSTKTKISAICVS